MQTITLVVLPALAAGALMHAFVGHGRSPQGTVMKGRARGVMAVVAVAVMTAAACSTGVEDAKGWRKALARGYSCAELLDIASDLPDDVDRTEVERDLTRLGCRPPNNAHRVDWNTRTVSLTVPEDWSLQFCEGEGPFLCVSRDGRHVGSIELLEFEPPDEPLKTWAEEHYRTVQDDRTQGCGGGYQIEPDRHATAPIAGTSGVRVAFTGRFPNGRATERSITYAAVLDGRFFLIVAHAYESDGCIGTEGDDFTVESLRAFEPILADVAAFSKVGQQAWTC